MNFSIELSLSIDFKFWALFPALNINIHSKSLEFEWMCFGFYLDFNT